MHNAPGPIYSILFLFPRVQKTRIIPFSFYATPPRIEARRIKRISGIIGQAQATALRSQPQRAPASEARSPTHANPAAALVREGVRGRSQALDRSLRTPPKCPTRAKEQGCQLAGASSVCGHPRIIRYTSRNNTVETSYHIRSHILRSHFFAQITPHGTVS